MTLKFITATWLDPLNFTPPEPEVHVNRSNAGGAKVRRPIVVNGKFYRSMTEAMAETGLGVRAIYRLMGEGWRT